jgi:hypothetical protein
MQYVTIGLDGREMEKGQAHGDAAQIDLSVDGASVVTTHAQVVTPDPTINVPYWGEPALPLSIDPRGARALGPTGLVDLRSGATDDLPKGFDAHFGDRLVALRVSETRAFRVWKSGRFVSHDLATKQASIVHTLPQRTSYNDASFSHDGSVFAGFVSNRTTRRIDVHRGPTFESVTSIPTPAIYFPVIAALADGRVLVASPGRLDVFGASGEPRTITLPPKLYPSQMVASADGRVIVVRIGSASTLCGPLLLIDGDQVAPIADGDTIAKAVWCIAVRPDGERVVFATMSGLTITDVRTRTIRRVIECRPPGGLAFSADGRTLFAIEMDTRITTWDLSRD